VQVPPLYHAIKHTFDPHGLLNPGKVLPDLA
jgi:FAD/FMN-containing dehydrogenase